MKFDFKNVEQFIGKEVVIYDYYCRYLEGVITDWDIEKRFNGKVIVCYEIEITHENGKEIEPIKSGVDTKDFKKIWGFKGTPFAKYLKNFYEHKNGNYNKFESKKKELKYPDDLKKSYKEAYEIYQDSLGSICYPTYNFGTNRYELQIVSKTAISFENGKAYISPANRDAYCWSEFRLSDLNKKFFLTKKEGLDAVDKFNDEKAWERTLHLVEDYAKKFKIEHFEIVKSFSIKPKIQLIIYSDEAHKVKNKTMSFELVYDKL